jgi:hypothetical protein
MDLFSYYTVYGKSIQLLILINVSVLSEVMYNSYLLIHDFDIIFHALFEGNIEKHEKKITSLGEQNHIGLGFKYRKFKELSTFNWTGKILTYRVRIEVN